MVGIKLDHQPVKLKWKSIQPVAAMLGEKTCKACGNGILFPCH